MICINSYLLDGIILCYSDASLRCIKELGLLYYCIACYALSDLGLDPLCEFECIEEDIYHIMGLLYRWGESQC